MRNTPCSELMNIIGEVFRVPFKLLNFIRRSPIEAAIFVLAATDLMHKAEAGWGINNVKDWVKDRLPRLPNNLIQDHKYCVVFKEKNDNQTRKFFTCTSKVGGEVGRVGCALQAADRSSGTVYYGGCDEERNQNHVNGGVRHR